MQWNLLFIVAGIIISAEEGNYINEIPDWQVVSGEYILHDVESSAGSTQKKPIPVNSWNTLESYSGKYRSIIVYTPTYCENSLCHQVAERASCQSCHLRELDLCAATLVLFNQSPTGVATTEPDLNRQCTYINEAEQCFRNFTIRCMTPLQRELLGFVSEGSEKLLNEYCTSGTELRANYLKHAPCLNDAHNMQKDCLTDLQAGLESIGNSDFQKRIPMACCCYQRYMSCARITVEKKCGKAAVDFMQLLLRNAVSRLPEIVCTGYGSENRECEAILPPPGTPPQGSRSDSVLSRLFAAYLGN